MTRATGSTSRATAPSTAIRRPRSGSTASACTTTTCTAPTTRSAAAARSASTSSSTTAPRTSAGRSRSASSRPRCAPPGTRTCAPRRTSSAGGTGGSSRACSLRSSTATATPHERRTRRAHERRHPGPTHRRQRRAERRPARPRARDDGHRRDTGRRRAAGPAAGGRARADARRLGALGADRGPLRPHGGRGPLPPVVPLRGRGGRARPGRQRRPRRLQPRGRPAARRGDDRQGDPGGAPARTAAAHHGRALLQGLSRLQHAAAEDRLRTGAPGQRPPPAQGRAAARAGVPRGPQGQREALPRPLPLAPLRPRRLRGGGDARERPDRAGRRRRRRGGGADLRPRQAAPAADRPHLLPDHAHVPALRAARHARLPAREVPHPLPSPRAHREMGPPARRAVAGQGARADRRRRDPRHDPAARARHGREADLGLAVDERRVASRRILLTGLSTFWGGRLAQCLERDEAVEAIIGGDRTPPKVELTRTEFVQVADSHSLIRRIVDAAEIDTVVDTRLVVDSIVTTPKLAHENNVIGTMNVLAACNGPDSPVRKVVFKSSAHFYGCEQDDPAFFTEDMTRRHPARTGLERDIVEADNAVREFAERKPDVTVTRLRFVGGLGPGLRTSWSRLFALPAVPGILGFDPRLQFVHEEDIVGCLEHAVANELPGVYNCAGDGVLALSEVVGLLGKPVAPALPPVATGVAAAVAKRIRVRISPEVLRQMRFGRALDNRRLKATGYRYRYTPRETILRLAEQLRLEPILGGAPRQGYRYEHELEDFLRYSPSVRPSARLEPEPRPRNVAPGDGASALPSVDDLDAAEIVALLPSLDAAGLRALHAHEAAHRGRRTVLQAIERLHPWEPDS